MFLIIVITNHVSETVKELYIISDSCPGQNIVIFLATLAANGRFNKIFQYFPIRGNSFLPCDRDFGLI
jgi:hypothetical protein